MTFEEVKKAFFRYDGSLFAMAREEKEAYESYKLLNIPEEMAEAWKQELFFTLWEQLKESGLDSFYAADFSYWKGQVAEKYQEYHTLYEKIKGQQITGFRQLEEGVSQTDYENGISVLVNQTEQTYQADKTEVPPMAYVFIGM